MKLTYSHSIECCDCGTGYSVNGPLGMYQVGEITLTDDDKIVLCDECAEIRTNPLIVITEDNYFDVAEALHAVLMLWHDGGRGYELLCRSEFKPGMAWSESRVEEENEYFSEIEELYEKGTNFEAMEKILDGINEYLSNREEN